MLVVVVDNAGWHVAKGLDVPPNVALHYLPPCTPALQPAERLWPLVREGLANKTFDPPEPDGDGVPGTEGWNRSHALPADGAKVLTDAGWFLADVL